MFRHRLDFPITSPKVQGTFPETGQSGRVRARTGVREKLSLKQEVIVVILILKK